MMTEYIPLKEIHKSLRDSSISATDLMQTCSENYSKHEPKTNAYKTWDGDRALNQAKLIDSLFKSKVDMGPLMGIPTSAKDLFGVPGLPIFAGSSQPLDEKWQNAGEVIGSLLRQGSIITGKTHTVEFAFGGIGTNDHWGAPVNPWDSNNHRVPGGSSSGAGVSLIQGSALLALGTDTAGSVRIPASFTGTVGLKTTQDRWPNNGAIPLSSTLDTAGILTRSVEDAVFAFHAIDNAITGKNNKPIEIQSLQGIKVGVPQNFFWDGVDDSIVKVTQDAINQIKNLGVNLIDTVLPGCDPVYEIFQQGGLGAPELSAFLNINMPEKIEQLGPMVQIRVQGAQDVNCIDYLTRKHTIATACVNAADYLNNFDVIISPTIATTAPLVSDLKDINNYRKANMLALRNTSIGNLMGMCAISIPIGKDNYGIPVGLQLMSGPNTESKLLAIASLIEQHIGKPHEILGKAPLIA